MSRETMQWLNNNTLIGFTDKRGNAWHYRASDQGAESNHYPGAIPIADVRRRLLDWQAISTPIYTRFPVADVAMADGIDDSGAPFRNMQIPDRQAISRSDTGHVMGIFSDGYVIHQYDDVLLTAVEKILGQGLSIANAVLLQEGAVMAVQVEMPDNIKTRFGVEFRPFLLASTSHNGKFATQFQLCITNVVCDNTHSAALGEAQTKFKVKRTRYSLPRVADARDALGLIVEAGDAFTAQTDHLCATPVTNKQWSAFLDAHTPLPEAKGRAHTIAENERAMLTQLWNSDQRVAPWRNTAWGVVQAVNTFVHHHATVRGTDRAERNMLRAVAGKVDDLDSGTLTTLNKILTNA